MPLDRGEDVEAPDRKSDGITSPPSSSA
jgi:hypothetical protein